MGLKEKLRKATSRTIDKLVDVAPIAGASAVGVASYCIFDMGLTYSVTFDILLEYNLFEKISLAFIPAFFTYNIIKNLLHKNIFNSTKDRKNIFENKDLDFLVKMEENKSLPRKVFEKFLDSPKAIMLSTYALLNLPNWEKTYQVASSLMGKINNPPTSGLEYYTDYIIFDEAMFLVNTQLNLIVLTGIVGLLAKNLNALNKVGYGSIKNWMFQLYNKMIGRIDKSLMLSEQFATKFPIKDNYLSYAKDCVKAGKLDSAAIAISNSLKSPSASLVPRPHIILPNLYLKEIIKNKKKIKKYTNKPENYLALCMSYLMINRLDDALRINKQIEKRFPAHLDTKYICALIDEGLGDKESARKKLKEIADSILTKKQFELKQVPFSDSRNQVFVYNPGPGSPISLSLIFKRGEDGSNINHDYGTNLFHYLAQKKEIRGNISSNSPINVPMPIEFLKHKAYFYNINRRRNAETIAETFNQNREEEKYGVVINSIINLARLHGIATKELSGRKTVKIDDNGETHTVDFMPFNYQEEFNRRIFDRFGHNKSSENINKILINVLDGEKTSHCYLLHGDYYETQFLADGTICDFEDSCLGDPAVDIALFLSNPRYDGFINIQKMIDIYIDQLYEFKEGIRPSELLRSFKTHELFHSICMFGSRHFHNDHKTAKKYFEKVQALAEEMNLFDLKREILRYASSVN